jgi:hypothetical protein
MLFTEAIAVYFEDHSKRINIFYGRMQNLYVLKQVVHIVTAGI